MSAQENLSPDQFTEMYHGTRASRVPSIREYGLEAPQNTGMQQHYRMLTTRKDEAGSIGRWGDSAVITYHVPNSSIGENEDAHLHPPLINGSATHYAIRHPLPASMISHVDVLDESSIEPHQRYYRPNG